MVITIGNAKSICPVTYSKVTTQKFERLINEWDGKLNPKGIIKVLHIFTGLDEDYITNSVDKGVSNKVVKALQFIVTEDLDKLPLPQSIMGVEVNFAKIKLAKLAFGQNLYMKQCMATDYRASISRICALYLQPIIDGGQFNEDRVDELQESFSNLPITDTYPIGSFFIKQQLRYGRRLINPLPQMWKIIQRLLNVGNQQLMLR